MKAAAPWMVPLIDDENASKVRPSGFHADAGVFLSFLCFYGAIVDHDLPVHWQSLAGVPLVALN
jgi:hypothetical protein